MIIGMKTPLENAFDFRQSSHWADYMRSIGWEIETTKGIQIYIRKVPWIGSFIKIQHPLGTIPFKTIDALAQKHHAIWVIIEPHISGYNHSLFLKNGYYISSMHHAPTATRKINISKSISEIVRDFSENAKRNIKKAEKNKAVIKTVFGKDDKDNTYFEHFYKLQKNLTDMKKFYAPGYSESKKKYAALKPASFFVFAYVDKIPIAGVWYGYYNGMVTYLQTGITRKGYDLMANYLLVLEGIKTGKKLKCNVFDFESIYDERYPKESKRWKGYTEFKSRFHGEKVLYPPSWIKFYNPIFRWFYNFSKPFI